VEIQTYALPTPVVVVRMWIISTKNYFLNFDQFSFYVIIYWTIQWTIVHYVIKTRGGICFVKMKTGAMGREIESRQGLGW
jgi:hypothetical protein